MSKNLIKKLSFISFFGKVKERRSRFANASNDDIKTEYPINRMVKKIHPEIQHVKIKEIIQRDITTKSFVLVPDVSKGTDSLAYFSAGQYVSVNLEINGIKTTRAYSLSSSPKESLDGFYEITVRSVDSGLASQFINSNWQIGTEIEISAPQGSFDYQPLRDAPVVVGIAGGSGITPFVSMAKSIKDNDEDFNLILLYGCKKTDEILFKKELDSLQQSCERIKIIYVLSDEKKAGFEYGFITSDLIKKYVEIYGTNNSYSIFVCGSQNMYNFIGKEIESLNLQKKYVRYELFGEVHGNNQKELELENHKIDDKVKITITRYGETIEVFGSYDDTILQTLEKNNIIIPSKCRSGVCGWCHTLLKSGQIYVPENTENRRKADKQFNFIHPCCTFPLSDLVIEN